VVVALKSRTIPAAEAVGQSLAAARALLAAEAQQLFFKYCSTFDSTDTGNIGPVIDALLELTGETRTIACPAFPANGRTVFKGHLFVGDVLLSESSMKDHPLTPMRDANLVRVLARQTRRPVSLIARERVAAGSDALERAFAGLDGIAIVDAIDETDLRTIGRAVILAGSCSAATRRQVAAAEAAGLPSLKVEPAAIHRGETRVADAVAFVLDAPATATPLVYSSAEPEAVARVQAALGRTAGGELVEGFFAELARELKNRGVTRFLVAGGETSGAVVGALGVTTLAIGPEIDPGVPWTVTRDAGPPLALALKSGNFGTDDFFIKAWRLIA
jgi:uncharacterized protein YgbK (DUF1537 family)